MAPVVVQGPAVASNIAPVATSGPKEAENSLLLKAVPPPLSVAVGKGNVELSTSSDDDSSGSGNEESESGSDSDSSSTTSSSGSHTEKPSFPTEVGTVVVSIAELVAAASAASVAIAKVLGPRLPSTSLFECPPVETLPETYGPGKPEEAGNGGRHHGCY